MFYWVQMEMELLSSSVYARRSYKIVEGSHTATNWDWVK